MQVNKKQVQVFGVASQKSFGPFVVSQQELEISLLQFLTSRGIPIASSCGGEGVCRKCVVTYKTPESHAISEILSCEFKLKNLLESSINSETIYLEIGYI